MSSAKYTEGPWGVGEKCGDFVDINHYDNSIGAVSKILAKVTSRLTWLAESEANARLIAASPDMYKALERVIEILDLGKDENEPYMEELMVIVKSATSKALGESQ